MIYDLITKNIPKSDSIKELPDWVNKNNKSYEAYLAINTLRKRKIQYIKSKSKPKHFIKKGNYQINRHVLARMIKATPSTLFYSTNYSNALGLYLDKINNELNKKKLKRIKRYKRSLAKGTMQHNKDDISKELKITRQLLAEAEALNTHQISDMVYTNLPLPIKIKFGIDV